MSAPSQRPATGDGEETLGRLILSYGYAICTPAHEWRIRSAAASARSDAIKAFVSAAVQEEREACAKIADWYGGRDADGIAETIRARSLVSTEMRQEKP